VFYPDDVGAIVMLDPPFPPQSIAYALTMFAASRALAELGLLRWFLTFDIFADEAGWSPLPTSHFPLPTSHFPLSHWCRYDAAHHHAEKVHFYSQPELYSTIIDELNTLDDRLSIFDALCSSHAFDTLPVVSVFEGQACALSNNTIALPLRSNHYIPIDDPQTVVDAIIAAHQAQQRTYGSFLRVVVREDDE
jgi:hypothetical protein